MRPSDHSSGALLSAVFADAVDLEGVASGLVMIFAPDLLFELVYLRREKFDGAAALGADHMMMAAPVVLVLVTGNAIMKGNFTCQSAFGQQLQRAINGGVADLGIALAHKLKELFGGEVLAGLKEGEQDGITLPGMLQSYFFQMFVEDLLRLPQRFAGDGRVIVNSSL